MPDTEFKDSIMRYNVCIVGCGITGSVLARLFAEEGQQRVLILEKRPYLGGQCYDHRDEQGLIINEHGAHIFHTRIKEAWDFLNRFTAFNDYVHHVQTLYQGRYYDWPITLDTINAVYGTALDAEGAKALLQREAQDDGGASFESAMVRQIGRRLYEMFIKNYTEKMWRRPATELAADLAFRIPLRLNNDKRLFDDPWQGIPKDGFSAMFQNLLDHPLIEVQLNQDYRPLLGKIERELLIVTSPLDEFYDYRFGRLEYRGMRFVWKTYAQASFQPVGTVNTPDLPDLLRREEPKKYYQQAGAQTSIAYNYPGPEGQYYPVVTQANREMAAQYLALADAEPHTCLAGRLGRYAYINMDQATLRALELFRKLTHLRKN